MLVKICGITNVADAQQATQASADVLGFNFWPGSPRYITPEKAAEIVAALPDTVRKAGVFVDASVEEILRVCLTAGLDIAQVHGEPLPVAGIEHWQAFSATAGSLAERMMESTAVAFVIDTPAGAERGGTGRTFDWSLAAGLPGRVILAGGLGADNVAEAIRAAQPWGVDACSRLEREPGKKDPRKVEEFIRAARGEEA